MILYCSDDGHLPHSYSNISGGLMGKRLHTHVSTTLHKVLQAGALQLCIVQVVDQQVEHTPGPQEEPDQRVLGRNAVGEPG